MENINTQIHGKNYTSILSKWSGAEQNDTTAITDTTDTADITTSVSVGQPASSQINTSQDPFTNSSLPLLPIAIKVSASPGIPNLNPIVNQLTPKPSPTLSKFDLKSTFMLKKILTDENNISTVVNEVNVSNIPRRFVDLGILTEKEYIDTSVEDTEERPWFDGRPRYNHVWYARIISMSPHPDTDNPTFLTQNLDVNDILAFRVTNDAGGSTVGALEFELLASHNSDFRELFRSINNYVKALEINTQTESDIPYGLSNWYYNYHPDTGWSPSDDPDFFNHHNMQLSLAFRDFIYDENEGDICEGITRRIFTLEFHSTLYGALESRFDSYNQLVRL